jgi:hypothetical protein
MRSMIPFVALLAIGCGSTAQNPSTTPAGTPTAATAAASAPVKTPAPPKVPSFGDGVHQVGVDIQPGLYRTRQPSPACYWARLRDFSGGLDSIVANDNTDGPAVVEILATDKGFRSERCGTWTQDVSAITPDRQHMGEGTFIVGTDIEAGTYRSSGGSGCYWEREANFAHGGVDSILANDNVDGPAVVTIAATDKGFKSARCGTWTKVG